jgi:hypothetical protein
LWAGVGTTLVLVFAVIPALGGSKLLRVVVMLAAFAIVIGHLDHRCPQVASSRATQHRLEHRCASFRAGREPKIRH